MKLYDIGVNDKGTILKFGYVMMMKVISENGEVV